MPYERDARNNAQRRNDVNAIGDRYGSLESSSAPQHKRSILYSPRVG
jgi:hypothetical protein